MNRHPGYKGYTLVELMITIAVVSIITAIAVPMYNGYIREGHFATIRSDMNGLRTPIEDFRLEYGTYEYSPSVGTITAADRIKDFVDDISSGSYAFTVSASTNSYVVQGVFSGQIWVRCENRMNKCCDADTPSATAVTAACP